VTRPRIRLLRSTDSVQIAGIAHAVVQIGGTDQRPVLRTDRASSREQAEALRGQDVLVARALLAPLAEDEWLAEDLIGCSVIAGERDLGSVGRLLAYPSCDLLEVPSASGALLIPLISDAVLDVDVEAKRILVDGSFLGLGEEAEGAD